jgi:hypothetical protein
MGGHLSKRRRAAKANPSALGIGKAAGGPSSKGDYPGGGTLASIVISFPGCVRVSPRYF